MIRRNLIQEQWDSCRRNVLSADATTVQIVECRRAFYAGAQALRVLFEESPNGMEEMRMITDLINELDEFAGRESASPHGRRS